MTAEQNKRQIPREDSGLISRCFNPGEDIGLINLGCARNLVDAQEILGRLRQMGCRIVDPAKASTIILNTCGFIEEAKKESVDMIVDLVELKRQGKIKKLFVIGCLSQRYSKELSAEFAEIDGLAGINPFETRIAPEQVYLTPDHFSYLKICESCYNHCSFCAIPFIKGRFQSRSREAVLEEAIRLDQRGVKEINIIGQDITAYGMDIYAGRELPALLREICRETRNVEWVRLLYAYPAHVTDELISVVAEESKICKYIDIPLQHINDRILKKMNRGISSAQTKDLLAKIRCRIPEVRLRSSFIVGFPGETEGEFRELLDFLEEVRFDRAGAFVFSPEEGTPAFHFPDPVPDSVKRRRYDALMRRQQKISKEALQKMVGMIFRVLVDEKQKPGENGYIARTEYDAPEVDGSVFVYSDKDIRPGTFIQVRITDALEYDLVGELV
ncbi:MAG: 30S ribosomal protein S12 methylthiotransferase RimO [Candidatus Omnitrophota bacterium]|jgi:ribosomal protein S12 methylthiotransferase